VSLGEIDDEFSRDLLDFVLGQRQNARDDGAGARVARRPFLAGQEQFGDDARGVRR
jgi:hypothetical protein